jgi:hypothetical protein
VIQKVKYIVISDPESQILPLQGPSVKDNAIVVQMTFGGTELEVKAVEKTTKKRLTATFDFLDH